MLHCYGLSSVSLGGSDHLENQRVVIPLNYVRKQTNLSISNEKSVS